MFSFAKQHAESERGFSYLKKQRRPSRQSPRVALGGFAPFAETFGDQVIQQRQVAIPRPKNFTKRAASETKEHRHHLQLETRNNEILETDPGQSENSQARFKHQQERDQKEIMKVTRKVCSNSAKRNFPADFFERRISSLSVQSITSQSNRKESNGFDQEQSSERFNINLSNKAKTHNNIESQLPQLGRVKSGKQSPQDKDNFQNCTKLSSWRDGLVQGPDQVPNKLFSQAFLFEQNLGGDNAMSLIRSSMQSNTMRQIQDFGVGCFPSTQDYQKMRQPHLGPSRPAVLSYFAKNELMKTQESINFGDQLLLQSSELQNFQKTIQKPKQLQPLLKMNYQGYRQVAQNLFNDIEDCAHQSVNSLDESPYRRENQIFIKLDDGSYIKVDQQVNQNQQNLLTTSKMVPLVLMTPSDELISDRDLGSGKKINEQQYFINSAVKESTDSLISKFKNGSTNSGNFTINAKSIRIVNKNYFNDSNGMQQTANNQKIQESLQKKQKADQEKKEKKLIRVQSQKFEKQDDQSLLQLQEGEVKQFSRKDNLQNGSKQSSRENSSKKGVSPKNVVTNLVQNNSVNLPCRLREIQTPNFNIDSEKQQQKADSQFKEQRPKLSVKFLTSNLVQQEKDKANFLERVQSFQTTDQNSSNAQSNCKRSSNEETSFSQSQSSEIPFLENTPSLQKKGGPIIKIAHHKSEEISHLEHKKVSSQKQFQKKSSFKLAGQSSKKKVLFMHQVSSVQRSGKTSTRAEDLDQIQESVKEEHMEEGKEPDYSGGVEVANLTFGFGEQ